MRQANKCGKKNLTPRPDLHIIIITWHDHDTTCYYSIYRYVYRMIATTASYNVYVHNLLLTKH